MKKAILIGLLAFPLISNAQVPEEKPTYKKSYWATVSETILSLGDVGNVSISSGQTPVGVLLPIERAQPVPRFSAFFHLGQQFHMNLSNTFGFYTGFGIRNMGMINRLNDTIRIKQRVYSLGIPAAIKIGDMGRKHYASIGAELELFFNYKQKTFLGSDRGKKVEKFNEWASNRTELLNPSVFAEFCFGKGHYLKIRYYLNDFLKAGNQTYKVDGTSYSWLPEKSQLFAVSYGRVISKKRK